jgi:hypothetical protein
MAVSVKVTIDGEARPVVTISGHYRLSVSRVRPANQIAWSPESLETVMSVEESASDREVWSTVHQRHLPS